MVRNPQFTNATLLQICKEYDKQRLESREKGGQRHGRGPGNGTGWRSAAAGALPGRQAGTIWRGGQQQQPRSAVTAVLERPTHTR